MKHKVPSNALEKSNEIEKKKLWSPKRNIEPNTTTLNGFKALGVIEYQGPTTKTPTTMNE